MLVSAAIEPYRKSYGYASSSSAMWPGSMASERSTASPRNTCVPGVHACAVPGRRAMSRRASALAPTALDAQPPPTPANRLAKILQLSRDRILDCALGGVEVVAHLITEVIER